MGESQFLTVYDLGLSPEEAQLWGGLPRTPNEYPRIDGLSPQDSALLHIVMLCVQRGDHDAAMRHADLISDRHAKQARLAMIRTDREKHVRDTNKSVGTDELVVATSFEIDALVNVLARKGIVTEDEILDEIRRLRARLIPHNGRGSA